MKLAHKPTPQAGILEAYPGFNIQVEGFTDSVGTDEMNQTIFGEPRRHREELPGPAVHCPR
jgi:hypothetical protein